MFFFCISPSLLLAGAEISKIKELALANIIIAAIVRRMDQIPEEKILTAAQGLRAIAHELRLSVLCHLQQ